MKNLFFLLLLSPFFGYSAKYYVATTGNDNNAGTITAPFKTWAKLSSVMVAGDTAYIRGGTYRSTQGNGASVHCYFQNLHGNSGNWITIQNYPGEQPILNLDDILPTYTDPTGIYLNNSSYLHIKGLRITGLQQNQGGAGISRGFDIINSPNCIFEQIEVDHIGGGGFHIYDNSNDLLFLNCDSHNNDDRWSSPSPWGGADGFSCTGGANSTRITFDGCRSWWNSDDGWDNFKTDGIRTWKNCWAFWNGYEPGTFTQRGNGEGFKLGPMSTDQSTVTLRFLQNCMAFANFDNGFDQNGVPTTMYQLYNNTSYKNGGDGFNFQYYESSSLTQTFKNNVAYGNGGMALRYTNPNTNNTNNTWNNAVSLSNTDFQSMDTTGVTGPRQADGSLPYLGFMRLAAGSDLINAGTPVGLPYNGSAPDMGAYEYAVTANVSPTANASIDQTITLPVNSVTLSGSGTDPDGTITSYLWTKVSGPTAGTITNSTLAGTTITALVQGIYKFELKVTDNSGATDTDTMQVIVNAGANQRPVANAGPDQNIILPLSISTLSGSGSDPDGTITTYQWTIISGPTGGLITNLLSALTTVTGLIQGTYKYELKVTDNNGATATDTMQIIVNPLINQAPTANAGVDQSITLPLNNVTLSGSGTDPDGTIASYLWTKVSGPANGTITNAGSAGTAVTALVQGTYQFQLKVTDNGGASSTDIIQIIVNPVPNQLPTVNAGVDQTITLPVNSFTLSGTATDPDGTIASYLWTKISGPTSATITNSSSKTTTVTTLVQGTYKFELKVTDNSGATATDTLQIIVNAAANRTPIANAGADKIITLPTNSVSLAGSGTDPDGTITAYLWTKISGPASGSITNSIAATTTVTALVQGTYKFQLKVTDNGGTTATDTMQVIVNPAPNQNPTANAGVDKNITLPTNSVSLTGSGTDPDGTITTYLWTKISGPVTGTITNTSLAITTVTALVQGTYKFELKITDNAGATATDTMQVIVNAAPNQAPTANAGVDKNITLPTNSVSLAGSGADPDGTISAYLWTKISGSTSATITNSTAATTTITALAQGTYLFQFKVTDNSGAAASDTMQLTVNAANIAPTADAGADQNITLPNNSVSLTGSGTDPDGTITTYLWTKLSGPTSGTITNASSVNTTVTGLVLGTYQFQLKVTDNIGATSANIMQVTVNAAPNQLPIANAGVDKNIILPVNYATLAGTGNDPDGTITAYRWRKISGPASFTITNISAATTTVTGLVQGIYQFEFKVTDNVGAVDRDTMIITVDAAINQNPIANAGIDQTITLPDNIINLSGNGNDPDGTITAYSWTKIYGPVAGNIATASSATTMVSGLTEGIYSFELTVTDNHSATGKDTIEITVNPEPNEAPTAEAGPNQTITLPVNTVTLSGSGTDPDGTIVSYLWSKISGPAAGTITNLSSPTTTVTGLIEGVYQYQLEVTDNDGAITTDVVQVNVNAAVTLPNQSPIANAGIDKNITLPVNSTSLNGSGTDPDGTISAYFWRKISGPGGNLSNITSANANATNLSQGTYRFELKVTDNNGAVGRDTMQLIVNAAVNQSPIANAGADKTITLPVSSVTLSGSGTDPNGFIASYFWTKISGPATGNINNAHAATTSVNNLQEAVYKFELKVTDNNGATDTDTMQVTVNPAPNQAPSAEAGSNQTITLPVNTATLAGSGADPDGSVTSYAWVKISGPAAGTISNASAASTQVIGLIQGVYQFQLTVTDNDGATDTDIMQVNVNAANILPVANAGSDRIITLPVNGTFLNGSGNDPDGTIAFYSWTKISGPAAGAITNATSASTTVTGLVEAIYLFQLKVTDNNGATDTDTMQVTVNPVPNAAPTADAGPDQTITLPVNIINLSGTGADNDGTITSYSWNKISGPTSGIITNSSYAATSVTGLTQGIYEFELTVTDNDNATATDIIQVTVNPAPNQAPTANAGADQNIILPINSVSLAGSGTDPDGTITSYLWTKISGPTSGTLTNPATATTTVTGLTQGIYSFELKVTDNSGATATDMMQVTVYPANIAPTANAGADKVITLPVNTTPLTGSGTDTDGTITSYFWTKISGPTGGAITNSTAATTSVTALLQGVYKFELKVTDNNGTTDTDTMQVTVNPAPNQAPTANAGLDKIVTLPANATSLTGSGTDTDGTIASYLWTKISGPTGGTITNSTAATTSVTALILGVYKFELKVTDNNGATDTDTVQVTVNAPANQLPVANAGADLIITLPANAASLSGSGTDPDGTIVSYLWTKISGPTGGTIINTATPVTSVLGLTQGVYKFQLKVTDNGGATDTDTMQITVNAINLLPNANAGSDLVITLPVNSVNLSGNGTDSDGTIASYLWTKITGPASGTITNAISATTSATGLVQGIYKFQLRVTDNSGGIDLDTMQVTVQPAASTPNQTPTANAGVDQTITLPVNFTSLSGSGTDPDGTIVSYLWTKITGPTGGAITNNTSATTAVTGLLQGVYKFELKVTDNSGASDTDTMQIIVNAAVAIPNQAPTANAGTNLAITLPVNSVSLAGSGADIDGTIASYLWTKISGPTSGTITNASSANTTVTGLTEGVYLFKLIVTDNDGATGSATVQVTVRPAILIQNIPPTAYAGRDTTIYLPEDSLALSGTGFDTDGIIVSYNWTLISRRSQYFKQCSQCNSVYKCIAPGSL